MSILKVNFRIHIEYTIAKANNALGFIKRTTTGFTDIAAIIHLYNAMVLSNLIYCISLQIWSPFTNVLINMLESRHHKFIRYFCFKIGRPISTLDHDYTIPATEFNITTIKSFHHYHDYILIYKILNNYLSCSSINNFYSTV